MGNAIVLIIVVAIYGDRDPEKDVSSMAAAALQPIMTVSAPDLFSAYEANQATAEELYGQRRLQVSGTVSGIVLDSKRNPVIQLASGNDLLPVQARVSDSAAASALSTGDEVTVLCEEMAKVLVSPILAECKLV